MFRRPSGTDEQHHSRGVIERRCYRDPYPSRLVRRRLSPRVALQAALRLEPGGPEVSQSRGAPVGRVELRTVPRAPVCVRSLVALGEKEPGEYLTCDLSIAGIRFCGQPQAGAGAEAQVWLYFSHTVIVRASGVVLRVSETDGRPEFAFRFTRMREGDREIIQQKVSAALAGNLNPSVLFLATACDPSLGRAWLESLRSLCRVR